MGLDFKHASVVDGVRFTAQVGVPNVVLGLFAKRTLPARVSSTLHGDHLAYLLVEGLVRRLCPDPFWIRLGKEEVLLVHHPDDIKLVLEGSPEPFAPDPDTKRKGMLAFQPTALTISRGDLWANRRRFAEAVLDTGAPIHRLAPRFVAVALEEADALAERGAVRWDDLHSAFQRITRRVVFGDTAADDTGITDQLGDLMAAGNRLPGKPAPGYEAFIDQVQAYVDAAEAGSLCSLVAAAPADAETDPAGQLVHWLFAMGDTLPANLLRALALLATHPDELAAVRSHADGADLTQPETIAGQEYLAGCILEAMRLWPTTQLFGRVATEDVRFSRGAVLPAGRQALIYNLFNHRNRARIAYADRFAPEEWLTGSAPGDWSFNFFSNGPQGCPGAGLAVFLGQAVLARLVTGADLELSGANLDPADRLPYALDIYGLTVKLTPR
jgi:cytochrome P450